MELLKKSNGSIPRTQKEVDNIITHKITIKFTPYKEIRNKYIVF